nr:hypothetical protein [Tanacetum cinerariifolium]
MGLQNASFSYLVQLIYNVTLLDPYSAVTHSGGVTDWHQEPRGPASPTAVSSDYVADFDLDKDSKEDLEEDHADYPADGEDGDDEPSDDDDDDDCHTPQTGPGWNTCPRA